MRVTPSEKDIDLHVDFAGGDVGFTARGRGLEQVLFDFLQELIYRKDAENRFYRVRNPLIEQRGQQWRVSAELKGEQIDACRHRVCVDVKDVRTKRECARPGPRGVASCITGCSLPTWTAP